MRRLSSRFFTVERGMLMLKLGGWQIEVFRTVIWIAVFVFFAVSGLWLWILLLVVAAAGFYAVSSRPAEVQELGPYLAVIGWTVAVTALGDDTAAEPFYLAAAQLLPVVLPGVGDRDLAVLDPWPRRARPPRSPRPDLRDGPR